MDDEQFFFHRKLSSQGLNLYETLGVSPRANLNEIKKAYRKLALQFHPDKNIGDNNSRERFQSVNYAYSVLVDPQKRRFYDKYGSIGLDLLNHVGESRALLIIQMKNPFIRALLILGVLITGCCFCYCCYCLCCYNFCCGFCVPNSQVDSMPSELELLQMDNDGDTYSVNSRAQMSEYSYPDE